jgi:uroporphyrinogen-III synthase
MRLLVTRPEPGASILAEELRELGHEPILQPLLEFRALNFDPAKLHAAEALIITSGNCLRALEDMRLSAHATDIPLYCVGEETARRAQAAGFKELLATADTAEQLAAKIIATGNRNAALVHLTGEDQAFDLAGALSREGFRIKTVRVYNMKACREFAPAIDAMLKAGDIHGVILMSPRTAEIYVSLCQRHGVADCAKSPLYFCLSKNVAAKLASLQPNDVRVSRKPNRTALLELLVAD